MENDNPYAAPLSDLSADDRAAIIRQRAWAVLGGWVRLGVWYNVVLVVEVSALLLSTDAPNHSTAARALALLPMIIPANICFAAGPVIELLWDSFSGWQTPPLLRRVVFVLGTLLAMGLAWVCVAIAG